MIPQSFITACMLTVWPFVNIWSPRRLIGRYLPRRSQSGKTLWSCKLWMQHRYVVRYVCIYKPDRQVDVALLEDVVKFWWFIHLKCLNVPDCTCMVEPPAAPGRTGLDRNLSLPVLTQSPPGQRTGTSRNSLQQKFQNITNIQNDPSHRQMWLRF